ncbi:PTS sugar transporter subunit IIA [Ferdinandcohnia quinoae]|uniref:PTS glucose transporter subunit IIA n=1 Tax=Fredinandcohnia quinoae TaxID=2918902 RepID=A0AAW5E9F3_9BACI|nr:PTS glucose transporter subunit IIA [Fredinandcohnia sp. SECRCQ15]MCH1626290.1 PTS glucose transporter subunit IIA [Fredinandcohnia sp. SECRCQ15]
MFKKLFGSKDKNNNETIFAPLNGKLLSIEEVPDPVFSQKMMGDGLAIEPIDGKVVSPVKGEIIQVFPTKHAVGIKTETGLEVLIHIGLDTVQMKGEGFTAHVSEGSNVDVGSPLVTFDLDLVREKAASTITPIVITNFDFVESFEKVPNNQVSASQTEIAHISVK